MYSISAFAYLQPSLIRKPLVPRAFNDPDDTSKQTDKANGFLGDVMRTMILNAMCDISERLNEVMAYNRSGVQHLGSAEDIERRMSFLNEVRSWRRELPKQLRVEDNFQPPTFFLRCGAPTLGYATCANIYSSFFEDKVMFAIFRPLPPDLALPDGEGCAGEICASHCRRSIEGLEQYERIWSLKEYSSLVIYVLFNTSLTLVNMLRNPETHDIFARTCKLLIQRSLDFPFTTYLLQALRTLAEQQDVPIPAQAAPYFQALNWEGQELTDVPISFVLPAHEDALHLLAGEEDEDEEGTDGLGVQLGDLLSRWSRISVT